MFKDFVCRFAKPHWLCLWLMANSLHAHADLEFLNTQLMEPNDAVIVAAEYSYFDISAQGQGSNGLLPEMGNMFAR